MRVSLAARICLWCVLMLVAAVSFAATDTAPAAAEPPAAEAAPIIEPAIELGEALGLDTIGQRIEAILTQYGLSASLTGRALVSVAVLLLLWLSINILRRILVRLRQFISGPRLRLPFHERRLHWYQRVMYIFGRVMLMLLAALALMVIWLGANAGAAAGNYITGALAESIDLAVLLTVAAVVFEIASATIEHFFNRWGQLGSSRLNTLLPIARNVAYGALFIIFGLTFLSELGVNVMPLLAGAGVLGFAIGFGSQALIKDLITGFIIIFEDLIQVGDVASVGGHSGLVERITIRKVQLRGQDGAVYTVPFSAITTVTNLTKDYSFYVFNVGVAYRESPDEVIKLLSEISTELRADPNYKDDILEPIEVMGVDQFGDNAIIIKARIKTLPIKQWRVGREFNRRMKYVFDQHNIEIPFPHRTLYFGEDKRGNAPSLHVVADGQQGIGSADTSG